MRYLSSLFFLCLCWGCVAMAQPLIPKAENYVTDTVGLLSNTTKQTLNQELKAFEGSDSTQIAVLIIPSLDGETLESYSLQVLESWGIGQKGKDNGALLLIVKNDRKLRIEVGYGLEGRLTDLLSGRIIDTIISPKFKQGKFDEGVTNGVHAMMSAVKGEFKVTTKKKRSIHPLFIMLGFFLFSFIISRFNRSAGRRSRHHSIHLGGGPGGFSGGGSSGGGFSGGGGSGGGGGASGGW